MRIRLRSLSPGGPGGAPRFAAQRLAFAIVSIIAASAAVAQAPAASQSAQAAAAPSPNLPPPPLTYGVDVGVAETDNVTLVPSNKVSQTIALVDGDFDLKKQSRLLDADAKGDLSYLDYLQGAYGTELLGRFDGTLRATLVPQYLTWSAKEDFGQAALDPFTPTIPTNLQNENYFSTGPDLTLPFGGTEFVNLGARYARTTFQSSPFNSNRLQGNIAWGVQVSARSSVSLNADTERVLFTDTAVNNDYDRSNVFGRYEIEGARTQLTVELGATRLVQSGDEATPIGPFAMLKIMRRLSTAARLTLTAGSVLTDASNAFSGLASGATGVVGTAVAPITASSYTSNYASLGWDYVRNRTTLSLSGRWEKDSYAGQPTLDLKRLDGELRVTREFTRALSAQLLGHIFKTDYLNAITAASLSSTNYDDDQVAAVLIWRYGRGLEIKLRAGHDERAASGFDTGYKDNRVVLTIGYRPNRQPAPLDPMSGQTGY